MSAPPRISVPLKAPEDVIPHLGKPTHWRQGRSAKAVADSWFAANGLPFAVRAVLEQAPEYVGAELIDAWLERSTDLGDSRPSHSQTDLLGILGLGDQIAVLGIEAKVTEPFGPLVAEWLGDCGAGKRARLDNLERILGLDDRAASDLRYQLLHRTAAVLIEARRFRTKQAVMMVQSFCPRSTGFADFSTFCAQLGYRISDTGVISEARLISDVSLRIGWVNDHVPGESRASLQGL